MPQNKVLVIFGSVINYENENKPVCSNVPDAESDKDNSVFNHF